MILFCSYFIQLVRLYRLEMKMSFIFKSFEFLFDAPLNILVETIFEMSLFQVIAVLGSPFLFLTFLVGTATVSNSKVKLLNVLSMVILAVSNVVYFYHEYLNQHQYLSNDLIVGTLLLLSMIVSVYFVVQSYMIVAKILK